MKSCLICHRENLNTYKKVKQFLYRPGSALGVSRRLRLPDFKTVNI